VAGATGQQGGATAAELLQAGWHVRALTRHPEGQAARALAAAGAEIVTGDLGPALADAWGVFSVQPPGIAGSGVEPADEIRMGCDLADAAKAAGVGHFIYTSAAGADRDPGVPHFETKWAIERHVRAIGLPATILRPGTFMELVFSPYVAFGRDGLSFVFRADLKLPFIAVADIGILAALAFTRPGDFIGRALDIAGDELSFGEAAAAIGQAVGRPLPYRPFPDEVLAANPFLTALVRFGERRNFTVDIAGLRALHPGLQSFATWLDRGGRARAEGLLAEEAPRHR
jgi:uncharacterized protein YbjT (DUF2867 family)